MGWEGKLTSNYETPRRRTALLIELSMRTNAGARYLG